MGREVDLINDKNHAKNSEFLLAFKKLASASFVPVYIGLCRPGLLPGLYVFSIIRL